MEGNKILSTGFCLLLFFPLHLFAESEAFVPVTNFGSDDLSLDPELNNGLDVYLSQHSLEMVTLQADSVSTKLIEPECPTDKAGLTDGFQVFTYSLTKDMAAALSVWGQGELSSKDKVMLYQFAWYKDIIDAEGSVEGRCGSGVMLALRISDLQANITLTLPTLAATSQLGQSNIIYKLGTFGLSGAAIDAAIPNASALGKFNTESYATLMQSIDRIQAAYKATGAEDFVVTPRPIAIVSVENTPGAGAEIAIKAFAMLQIAQGRSCREAKSSVSDRSSGADRIIEGVYSSVAGKGCSVFSSSPSDEVQVEVADILGKYGLQEVASND